MKVETLLAQGAHTLLGVALRPQQLDRLVLYHGELSKWMRSSNLVARNTSAEQLVERHFLDSLLMAPLLAAHPEPCLLDIGSGAGFPGLVLAAYFPATPCTLVEPRQKRAAFLRHMVRLLALDRVRVCEVRAEDMASGTACSHFDHFSHITGRAVAEPALFLQLARPLATKETEVVLFLTRIEQLQTLPRSLAAGWRLEGQCTALLPFSRAPRCLARLRPVALPA